uniref:Putative secreted protein n=1 Tax=Amblyomma americanum TaxID=6943 RepID=A0A0C9R601_AMBAM
MKILYFSLLLSIMWWMQCFGQTSDYSKISEEDKKKLDVVKQLLNSTDRLLLLMAKNGSQHLLSTMCWTSQRTALVERGFRHVIRYRNQSNLITGQSARSATRARKTITFAVNYYAGLSKGHAAISVTDARTFEENAIRGVTGVYSISHVNKTEECFVIASNGLLGSRGCALWIKKKEPQQRALGLH